MDLTGAGTKTVRKKGTACLYIAIRYRFVGWTNLLDHPGRASPASAPDTRLPDLLQREGPLDVDQFTRVDEDLLL